MPLSDDERDKVHSSRARLLFAWSLVLVLGVLAVITSLGSKTTYSPPTAPSQEVRSFANAIATGDAQLLDSLLHEDIEHRDLASGVAVRGRGAWEALFRQVYPTATSTSGSSAEVVSSRLLTHNVAIANITLRQLAAQGRASLWPPHTSILLVFDRGRWRVVATRSGGEYTTLDHVRLVN